VASKHKKVGLRYGRALLRALISGGDSVSERERLLSALESLELMSSFFREQPEVLSSIYNPMINSERKKSLLKDLLAKVSQEPVFHRFVITVFENGRFSVYSEIVNCFRELVHSYLKLVKVRVTSVRELPQEEKVFVENALKESISGTPEFSWSVDTSILGGVLVEYDGYRIDASLKGRLAAMERDLLL